MGLPGIFASAHFYMAVRLVAELAAFADDGQLNE